MRPHLRLKNISHPHSQVPLALHAFSGLFLISRDLMVQLQVSKGVGGVLEEDHDHP